MKKLYLLVIVICLNTEIKADIAPNPIQARGISAKFPIEIKMTCEKVTVSLTLDSSFVHCYFKLHNEGKAEKIQIGYPCMNTTPYTLPNSAFAPINVYQNGKRIENISIARGSGFKLYDDESLRVATQIPDWDVYFQK